LPSLGSESQISASSRRKNSSFSEIDSRSSDSEEGESMVRILRDLSLETNGGYIGATSQITMGRLVGSIVKGKKYSIREEDLSPSQVTYTPETEDSTELRLSDISPDVADRLLTGYMKHIATRYPVLHSAWAYIGLAMVRLLSNTTIEMIINISSVSQLIWDSIDRLVPWTG
jgi:hypothetical protein